MEFERDHNPLLTEPHSAHRWDGDRIRILRVRLGWSQADLARRLGCRQQTVSEWETNVYQPQNAYSKLLDMMLNDVETYSQRVNEGPLTELVMKDRGIAQVTSEDLFMSPPTFPFVPTK